MSQTGDFESGPHLLSPVEIEVLAESSFLRTARLPIGCEERRPDHSGLDTIEREEVTFRARFVDEKDEVGFFC